MSLILNHISYTYDKGTSFANKALSDVSLIIEDGEFLGIIGHTGSGKSTLIQHMNGLLKPDEGEVLYNGRDVHEKDYDRRSLRYEVGLVFQYPEYQLFDETVLKDTAFGPGNMGYDKTGAEIKAIDALELCGVDEDVYDQPCFNLSGGQKRRVAIAGVLAMQPKVLVLDEPAAGLDPAGRESIMELISRLHETGTTIVMVSHSMEDISRLAERIVVMDKGRVAMDAAPGEIFERCDELRAIGLDVPCVVYVMNELRSRGVDVGSSVASVDEAARLIARAYRRGI